jgi:catechol 2,3-dioxygenase-like lactoylglutathione lyase family enzyme
MNRLHVHVGVTDLSASVRFYSSLFGAEPTVSRGDYAKWMLDDPRVNFAISARAEGMVGVNHLGIQAETPEELDALYQRLGDANIASQPEKGANCCYAHSDKHWALDPTGVVWEAFHTMGEIAVYGDDQGPATPGHLAPKDAAPSCCA